MGRNTSSSLPIDGISGKQKDAIGDFVKTLFRILEEKRFIQVVAWSDNGDFFIVKDTNQFTVEVLPRVFRHSNFASFVRQLNKYGFHKVRSIDEEEVGEECSAFKHTHFRAGCRDKLDNIVRKKAPNQTEDRISVTTSRSRDLRTATTNSKGNESSTEFRQLFLQVTALQIGHDELVESIRRVDQKYNDLYVCMSNLQTAFGRHNDLIRTLLEVAGNSENGRVQGVPFTTLHDADFTGLVGNEAFQVGDSTGHSASQFGSLITATGQASGLQDNFLTLTAQWGIPPHVLLVEDDAITRRVAGRQLQQLGCTVEVAIDGLDGVHKYSTGLFDLVLMDIHMPHMDGLSATAIIRQRGDRTPVISMTSNSSPGDVWRYFSGGMTDILVKPLTQNGLLGILEKYLAHLKIQVEGPRQEVGLHMNLPETFPSYLNLRF